MSAATDIQIKLTDGSAHDLRLHALEDADFLQLLGLNQREGLVRCLAKSLRVEIPFAERIESQSQMRAMMLLATMRHGAAEGRAITQEATQLVEERN